MFTTYRNGLNNLDLETYHCRRNIVPRSQLFTFESVVPDV